MYSLISPALQYKQVLELATGTELIAKHIVRSADHIEAPEQECGRYWWKGGIGMNYIGIPLGIWLFFGKSFQQNLTAVFDLPPMEAEAVMVETKRTYKAIIRKLPEFEKGDRFQANIIGCAMLGALDYAMSDAGGASHFVRKCTLAGGDAYCDCGYKKRR